MHLPQILHRRWPLRNSNPHKLHLQKRLRNRSNHRPNKLPQIPPPRPQHTPTRRSPSRRNRTQLRPTLLHHRNPRPNALPLRPRTKANATMNDPRYIALKRGLSQLNQTQLRRILNYDAPICMDTYNYDENTKTY